MEQRRDPDFHDWLTYSDVVERYREDGDSDAQDGYAEWYDNRWSPEDVEAYWDQDMETREVAKKRMKAEKRKRNQARKKARATQASEPMSEVLQNRLPTDAELQAYLQTEDLHTQTGTGEPKTSPSLQTENFPSQSDKAELKKLWPSLQIERLHCRTGMQEGSGACEAYFGKKKTPESLKFYQKHLKSNEEAVLRLLHGVKNVVQLVEGKKDIPGNPGWTLLRTEPWMRGAKQIENGLQDVAHWFDGAALETAIRETLEASVGMTERGVVDQDRETNILYHAKTGHPLFIDFGNARFDTPKKHVTSLDKKRFLLRMCKVAPAGFWDKEPGSTWTHLKGHCVLS